MSRARGQVRGRRRTCRRSNKVLESRSEQLCATAGWCGASEPRVDEGRGDSSSSATAHSLCLLVCSSPALYSHTRASATRSHHGACSPHLAHPDEVGSTADPLSLPRTQQSVLFETSVGDIIVRLLSHPTTLPAELTSSPSSRSTSRRSSARSSRSTSSSCARPSSSTSAPSTTSSRTLSPRPATRPTRAAAARPSSTSSRARRPPTSRRPTLSPTCRQSSSTRLSAP